MRITVLIENSACREDLAAEHGLSLYIEALGKKILFDAGQTAAFADNAEKLGVNLAGADFAVLSHGHYDHSGGLLRFRQSNTMAPIYVNQNALGTFSDGAQKDIGVSAQVKALDRMYLTGDHFLITPGISLFSCNDRRRDYPADPFGLNKWVNGCCEPDDFLHEQYLLIEENGTRVLFSGCSHKGVLNILEWFRPDVFVGGFHFMKMDPEGEALREAAQRLLRMPTRYYTGHCTGSAQFDALKEYLGDRLQDLSGGRVFTV